MEEKDIKSADFICLLEQRNCPFKTDGGGCSSIDTKCGFKQKKELEKEIRTEKTFVRKERWYEKYYE